MALNLSKQYTFTPSTTIASAQVNADFDDLYNALSGLEALTKTMAKLKVDVDPSTALEVATKQYVDHYSTWKRPVLKWVSISLVDVENNTGTANQTSIAFPDGTLISVTEDTSSANKYRRFDITATANFTSGTEDSGLRSGISEANNTWYAIYAVKSQINSANFVLAGDTTLPLQANYATLNTRYGTNSWVHLGTISNGDDASTVADILDFEQNGNMTVFRNVCTSTDASAVMTGRFLASNTPVTSLSYTYSAGTGSGKIPDHFGLVYWQGAHGATATAGTFDVQDGTRTFKLFIQGASATRESFISPPSSATKGVRLTASATALSLTLWGFCDTVLGIGSNPLL